MVSGMNNIRDQRVDCILFKKTLYITTDLGIKYVSLIKLQRIWIDI
jgi:hypothetical protein